MVSSLDLLPSVTSTPGTSQHETGETDGKSSSLPLPPSPSNLVMKVSNGDDLLITIDRMSGIEKLEIGARVKTPNDTKWSSWVYADLPPTGIERPKKDATCAKYQVKFRAKGDWDDVQSGLGAMDIYGQRGGAMRAAAEEPCREESGRRKCPHELDSDQRHQGIPTGLYQ